MVWRKNQNLKNCDGSTEYLITKNQFRSKLRGRLELKSQGARRFKTHHECHTTKFWGVQMSDSLAPGALKLTMRPHRAMGIPMPRSNHGYTVKNEHFCHFLSPKIMVCDRVQRACHPPSEPSNVSHWSGPDFFKGTQITQFFNSKTWQK